DPWRPMSQGKSQINADAVDGKDASQLGALTAFSTTLSSHRLNAGEYTALERFTVPSGRDIEVYLVSIMNDSFNTPSGLNVILRNSSTGTNEASFNTSYSEGSSSSPIATVTGVGGDNIIFAADNGNFGSGTGSVQVVNATLKFEFV
ncbi:MAG: hypothetical protein SVS85_02345, partial [Candidatus Nanohaloarchaea archaeon]|nr:hypothetical protein [Candidatus Nanohaloarchaea archaeon]